MKINSVIFDQHKVLGNAIVDFTGEKSSVDPNDFIDNGVKMNVEEGDRNHFTYVIGPNGVGKTVFFRTLINLMNVNSPDIDDRLESYIQLYPVSKKYEQFRSSEKANAELDSYSVYQKAHLDILTQYNAHLLYITSAMGGTPIHKNARYRSFNYLSDINKTKSLFVRALNKMGVKAETQLNLLLGRSPQTDWKMVAKLSYQSSWQGVGNSSEFYEFQLNTMGGGINTLIAAIAKIKLTQQNVIDTSFCSKEEINSFTMLYNDATFFKFFFDSGLTVTGFFNKLKKSSVFKSIKTLFDDSIVSDSAILPSIRIKQQDANKWFELFPDVKQLSEFDCELLIVLENMKLMDIYVTCDEVPIHLMSSGEQSTLRLFSFFADLPVESKNKNLLVFFDEPENTLHPKWQQRFHANFTELIKEIYKIKRSHFIISTHSPLMIMKTAGHENTRVLQFSKKGGEFISRPIEDINAYSIEEVMLDEFNISYRDKAMEVEYNKLLKAKSEDPLLSIKTSFDLKERIQVMFDSLK